jgi:hypothetical protein
LPELSAASRPAGRTPGKPDLHRRIQSGFADHIQVQVVILRGGSAPPRRLTRVMLVDDDVQIAGTELLGVGQ